METTFQILHIIISIYKKHGHTNFAPITEGLSYMSTTKHVYILKSTRSLFNELHTPYGSIKLHGNLPSDIKKLIEEDILTQLKGRYLTVDNSSYLITHINKPLKNMVRSTLFTPDELYYYLYLAPNESMTWNQTRAFYDSEIQRLVESGWLYDDLNVLKELHSDTSLCNYNRLICMLCELNYHEEQLVIHFRSELKQEKYIHIFGLLLLAGSSFHTMN
jgi:hypothetical protein